MKTTFLLCSLMLNLFCGGYSFHRIHELKLRLWIANTTIDLLASKEKDKE